ncbi:hypothetical protein [Hanstruepera flava]|uniref:hypothetical protein n=1 Tax=Hanstruepera flava TaxID=2930218 RepID=UPI002027C010|nr:hypothetical protein [Hanstruepera flava]
MKKLFRLIILFGVLSNMSFSQTNKKFYVDNNEDYVFLADSDLKYSNQNQPNSKIDVFVKTSENEFKYTLLISKITDHGFEKGNLLDGKYETYYQETCGCEVTEIDLVFYNNIKPLRHFISTAKGENKFKGINSSFVSGKHLYNILFLTFEKDFENQKINYADIMNTLVINGKTTVDSYSEYQKSE